MIRILEIISSNTIMTWEDYTLRKQLLIALGSCAAASLLIAFIISLGFTLGTAGTFKNRAEEVLIDQMKNHTNILATEVGAYFSKSLEIAYENFVSIYGTAVSIMFRDDYPIAPVRSYFEYGDTYFPELEYSERYGKEVSLEHSGYYFPGSTPSNLNTYPTDAFDVVNISSNADTYYKHVYAARPDFVAGYIGFQTEGTFRHYPGTSTLEADPNREYDPRVRPWYDTKNNLYTDPYLDAWGKGWMISITKVVRKDTDGAVIGVASSDMLISDIQNNILSLNFLDSGFAALFQEDGLVVAHPEWLADENDPTMLTYEDLKSPIISEKLWEDILDADEETITLEYVDDENDSDWVISASSVLNGKYRIVMFVPREEIVAPIEEIKEEIKTKFNALILSIFIGSLVVCGVIFGIIIGAVGWIVSPLSAIEKDADKLVSNIGREQNIFTSVTQATSHEGESHTGYKGVGETKDLRRNFANLMARMDNEYQENNMPLNPFYGQQNVWHQEAPEEITYRIGGAKLQTRKRKSQTRTSTSMESSESSSFSGYSDTT